MAITFLLGLRHNRRHHPATTSKKPGDLLTPVGQFRDLIGGQRFGGLKYIRPIVALLHGHSQSIYPKGIGCRPFSSGRQQETMTTVHQHPLQKILESRIAIIDGAMGTTIRTYA
jgi:hypothetical protein